MAIMKTDREGSGPSAPPCGTLRCGHGSLPGKRGLGQHQRALRKEASPRSQSTREVRTGKACGCDERRNDGAEDDAVIRLLL